MIHRVVVTTRPKDATKVMSLRFLNQDRTVTVGHNTPHVTRLLAVLGRREQVIREHVKLENYAKQQIFISTCRLCYINERRHTIIRKSSVSNAIKMWIYRAEHT